MKLRMLPLAACAAKEYERLQHEAKSTTEYSGVMQATSGGKVVLLEGPPGSGKSTVSRQLCKDWAVGVLGKEYELVVLEETYWNMPEGVIQHIEAVDGKGLLFILEGYDKITSQTVGVPMVIETLLSRSYLQLWSVIVSSRGIAAKSLYDKQLLYRQAI